MVERLFLAVAWGCLRFVIVVFPDHTHLLFLFLFCYERDFIVSLSDDKQADIIDAFNTAFRYLDDILNTNNVYFDTMVRQIYPSELQLNKANTSNTEGAF